MSFFGLNFGQNAEIDIILDNQDERRMGEIKDENGRKERLFLFYDGENVSGKVNVTLHRKTNRLEHQGIRIEFIGQIELYYDRGNHHEFLSLVKQLSGPGELVQNTSFDFEFNQVEKPFESYTGANVKLRYFLKVTIVRRLTDLTKEMDLLVHTLATYPEMNNPIKMEVGIEECLHIEFEYNKSKYHLKDVIVGKIYFLLVRIKIKHMEIAIIKRETTGSGPNTFHDNETIAKYEIMDGAPVRGESIPIRVFLAGYDLTPTMRDVNKKFSVKYYLNLVLVDEEERRYFKQQEITLWRKGERQRKSLSQSASGYAVASSSMHPQLPHAMARHIAGDTPTQNIRTAPTPSEPTTPVSLPGGFERGHIAQAKVGGEIVENPSNQSSEAVPAPKTQSQGEADETPSVPETDPKEDIQAAKDKDQTNSKESSSQEKSESSSVKPQNPADIEEAPAPNASKIIESPSDPSVEDSKGQNEDKKSTEISSEQADSQMKDVESTSDPNVPPPMSPPGRVGESPPPMDNLSLDDDEDVSNVMDLNSEANGDRSDDGEPAVRPSKSEADPSSSSAMANKEPVAS